MHACVLPHLRTFVMAPNPVIHTVLSVILREAVQAGATVGRAPSARMATLHDTVYTRALRGGRVRESCERESVSCERELR